MEEQDLKDYVVKLNDRNIQRQRETGFTLYAILGAIIFCFFYLIDNIPTLVSIINDVDFLNVAALTSNILFALSCFYLNYKILTRKTKVTKIFPYQEPLNLTIVEFPLFICFVAICTLNLCLLKNSQNTLHLVYSLFFAIIGGLNLISPFIAIFSKKIRRQKKIKKGYTIELIDFTFGNDKMVKIVSTILLIQSIILISFTIVLILNMQLIIPAKSIAEVVKYLSFFYGFLFLIEISMNIKTTQRDNNELEDFEKEIFFENLSNQDIAERFEAEFSGIPFSKWLSDKHSEIISFFEAKSKEFMSIDISIIALEEIDRESLPFEYTGRLNTIIKEQIRLLKETDDFAQKLRSNFNNLKNFGSLNDQEAQSLFYVQNFLNNNIRGFNNLYQNLSQQIVERQ